MSIPYAYGTENRTVRVWYIPYAYGTKYAYGIEQLYLTHIRIWYVPYAYGTKYAYGIEHIHVYADLPGL